MSDPQEQGFLGAFEYQTVTCGCGRATAAASDKVLLWLLAEAVADALETVSGE